MLGFQRFNLRFYGAKLLQKAAVRDPRLKRAQNAFERPLSTITTNTRFWPIVRIRHQACSACAEIICASVFNCTCHRL